MQTTIIHNTSTHLISPAKTLVGNLSSREIQRIIGLYIQLGNEIRNRIVFCLWPKAVIRSTIIFWILMRVVIRNTIIFCFLRKVVLQKTIVDRVISNEIIQKTIVDRVISTEMNKKIIVDRVISTEMNKKTIVDRVISTEMNKKTIVDRVISSEMNKKTIVDGGSQHALRSAITAFYNASFILALKSAVCDYKTTVILISNTVCGLFATAAKGARTVHIDAAVDTFMATIVFYICTPGSYKTNRIF